MKRKLVKGLATVLFLAASVGMANATPFSYGSSSSVAIPTVGTATSTITVSDVDTISDLDVYVDITHTFLGDLEIFLSHNGIEVQLFNEHHGDADNLPGVTFDDEAGAYINLSATPFVSGSSYKPTSIPDASASSLLSAFDTTSLAGDWILTVVDTRFMNDGAINEFRITGTIESTVIPEPGTMFLFGTGLVGLASLRSRGKKKA